MKPPPLERADQRTFDAALREDYPSFHRKVFHELCPGTEFLANWHLSAIAHQLDSAFTGDAPRSIINVPPAV